ncbi:S8 family serine peptidase [Amycolatopsis sp. NPDC058278]|uniref:S8 family serine peptidase n=1 Tax=Amycolatopsis sp. NPDC058278 TaxID=3346417 RepID=UPI0036DC9D43
MTTGRFRFAAMTVALTLSTLVSPAAAIAAAEAGPQPAGRTVTLVTGDQVTLTGRDQVRVRRAPGRENIGFRQRLDERGDVTVVPDDARELIDAGQLDSRLFDISLLVGNGYDDSARKDLPLIVTHSGDRAGLARPLAATTGARRLPSVDATAVRADKKSVSAVWAEVRTRPSDVRRVSLDGPVRADLDHSVPQIGAPQAWRAGYTGAGTTVAVLDSGIDATHPDLADAVADARDFTGSPGGTDDRYGHGTHVASIVTGSGAASGGAYQGVAPDTRLLVGKVLDDSGDGTESEIIAGMEWAAAAGAKIVTMSLGGPAGGGKGGDLLSAAVNRLTAQSGALFVVAAGNKGPNGALTSPGIADAALTVGAVDREDELADFSSRGPRPGDGAIKPDLTAPGVAIVAARAANGRIGTPAAEKYVSLSGTSMAVPHVAGAAALLAGEHPDWPAARLKSGLMNSAKPRDGLSVYQQGAGRVDVARAVGQPVQAAPASLSLGVARWPHTDDRPLTATVTYRNSGSVPVTLDLGTDVRDSTGKRAPDGMFTVSPGRLTVPAGGEAAATFAADTGVDSPDGTYGGVLVAVGAGSTVRTPVGVQREAESYDVKLTFVDWQGNPAARSNNYWFVDLDRPKGYPGNLGGVSSAVVRLPRGRYFLLTDVFGRNAAGELIAAHFPEPEITVQADGELTFDARTAEPAGMVVDRPDAADGESTLTFERAIPTGTTWARNSGAFGRTWVRPSTTTAKGFTYTAEALLARPDGQGGFGNSPYLYHLRWSEQGKVPTGLVRRFADRDLASVRSEHSSTGPGQTGTRDSMVTAALPFTLQEYYSPDTPWESYFDQSTGHEYQTSAQSVPKTYRRGRSVVERWNSGVFGPSFPRYPGDPAKWASRLGDTADFDLWLLSDRGEGHYGQAANAESGTTALYRDGRQLAGYPWAGRSEFTLPPEEAAYRLHTESVRNGPADLSTTVSADWTFRSGHVTGAGAEPLPLMAVRFAPALDDRNQAPAGTGFLVPVYLEHTDQQAALTEPAAQVSYDDGKTWLPAPLLRTGDHWLAQLWHPAQGAFVSFKATAADRKGNTVAQTIIRAYRLR